MTEYCTDLEYLIAVAIFIVAFIALLIVAHVMIQQLTFDRLMELAQKYFGNVTGFNAIAQAANIIIEKGGYYRYTNTIDTTNTMNTITINRYQDIHRGYLTDRVYYFYWCAFFERFLATGFPVRLP